MRAITKTDKASKHHQSNHILPRTSDAKGDKVISNASTAAYIWSYCCMIYAAEKDCGFVWCSVLNKNELYTI